MGKVEPVQVTGHDIEVSQLALSSALYLLT